MKVNRRNALGGLAAAGLLTLGPRWGLGDDDALPVVSIAPRSLGIDLPSGALRRGAGESVQTHDGNGAPVIGRLHVAVADSAIVLLPDGELVPRRSSEFSPTDRPFVSVEIAKIGPQLVADEFAGFKSKQTRHYVYIYNTSEEFALATSRILESMLPGVRAYSEAQKIAVHEPQVPLVVVMFKTEEEFQKHRPMPEGVVAYYDPLSNRVFMYEQSQLAQVRPDLAIQQSISTIAHEGAHQILHNIGVQQRLSMWPMWLSEGLAEYFAPTTFGNRMKWKGAGQVNDLRMFELEQYLKSRAADDPNGEMVEHTVCAGRLTSTGYATAWALTHYLAKMKRADFNRYVYQMSKLGPLETTAELSEGLVPENGPIFQRFFGSDLTDLEKRLVLHLRKQPYTDPFQGMPHFVAMIVANDGRRTRREATTFHSPRLAQKWVQETLEKLPADQRPAAQTSIRMFANRNTAEGFANQWRRGR